MIETLIVAFLCLLLGCISPCHAANNTSISPEFLLRSSQVGHFSLVAGHVEKLDRASGFSAADPPVGTIKIEKVYCGKISPGSLRVMWEPELRFLPVPSKGQSQQAMEQTRLKILKDTPMSAPLVGKTQFFQIKIGLEKMPIVATFDYDASSAQKIESEVAKQQGARNVPQQAKQLVQNACLSSCSLVKARVVKLDREYGCSCSNFPAGTVEIEKVYLGKLKPGPLRVIWDDFEQCKDRDCPVGESQRDLEYKRQQLALVRVACPQVGDVQMLRLSSKDGQLSASIIDYDDDLSVQVQKCADKLRQERASSLKHWDTLDYSSLAAKSTDIVIVKMINQKEVNVVRRLKDSTSVEGQKLKRPLYLSAENDKFPVRNKPFDGEVIAFLTASPDCDGWTPNQQNQALRTDTANDLYRRLTFRYKPASEADWVIPVTRERVDAIAKAVASSKPRVAPHPGSDRILEFVQLYFGARQLTDEAKIQRLLELTKQLGPPGSIYNSNVLSSAIEFYKRTKNAPQAAMLKEALDQFYAENARKGRIYVEEPILYWAYLDE